MDNQVKGAVLNGQRPPQWKSVIAATALSAYDTRVHVDTVGASYDITLPAMGEAVERGLYIIKRIAAAGGAFEATVVSKEFDGGGAMFTSDGLSAAADVLMVITDGERWYTLFDVTT